MRKSKKGNLGYTDPLGIRPNDKLEKEWYPKIDSVYKYDRNKFKDMNDFLDMTRVTAIHDFYLDFCEKHGNISVRKFLKMNAQEYEYSHFHEILFSYKKNKIIYEWHNEKFNEELIGLYKIGDYNLFRTEKLLFLQHRRTGLSYMYQGEYI